MRLPTPEQLWHERLRRAMDREGPSIDAQWANDMLVVRAHQPRFLRRAEDGSVTWVPNPAAGDDEATERATSELMDTLGRRMGVGPRPRRAGS